MAGQDIKKRLPAGGAQPVNVSGDYIYLKFADRPIDVIIDGGRSGQTRVTMEAGDKYRPGGFQAFEIVNTDQERPAQVIFTVGEGDYNRQIVKGEIQVVPALRSEDGVMRPDTRFDVELNLEPVRLTTVAYQIDDVVLQSQMANVIEFSYPGLWWGPENTLYRIGRDGSYNIFMVQISAIDGRVVAVESWNPQGTPKGVAGDGVYVPGYGFIVGYRGGPQVYVVDGSNTADFELLFKTGLSDVHFLAYDALRKNVIAVAQTGAYEIYGSQLELKSSGVMQFGDDVKVVSYDPARDVVCVGVRYMIHDVDPVTMQELGDSVDLNDISADSRFYNLRVGNTVYVDDGNGAGQRGFKRRVIEPYEVSPKFESFRPSCALISSLIDVGEGKQTKADISIERVGSGLSMKGELVRAALEYHFGLPVAGDYMDHVYGLRIGRDSEGFNQRPVITGTETFARAGVSDDFSAFIPGALTLTIDNELGFGSPLEF